MPSFKAHAALGIRGLRGCTISRLYFIENDLTDAEINRLCTMLLVDPVTELANWRPVDEPAVVSASIAKDTSKHTEKHVVEVTYRPGVTDISARELARGMAEIGIVGGEVVTGARYELEGEMDANEVRRLARQLLSNETVQHFSLEASHPPLRGRGRGERTGRTCNPERIDRRRVGCSQPSSSALARSPTRCVRSRNFMQQLGRAPTDVELETLAQTWSEHCVHKTFRAAIDFTWQECRWRQSSSKTQVDGLLKQYIRAATDAVRPSLGCTRPLSTMPASSPLMTTHDLAFKVETHNHPSALEPFGGANTGVGGVVRDILGRLRAPHCYHRCALLWPARLCHTSNLPSGILHPHRIADRASSPGLATMATSWACPRSTARFSMTKAIWAIRSSFVAALACCPTGSHPTAPQAGDHGRRLGGRTGRDGHPRRHLLLCRIDPRYQRNRPAARYRSATRSPKKG